MVAPTETAPRGGDGLGSVTTVPASVPNSSIREHARGLLEAPDVRRRQLALAFAPSSAASAEVLVGGPSFYPAMLEDIRGATSSVSINQFGFRPGHIGDTFAEALVAKAAEGVPVRLVVDRNGSDPEGSSREFYEQLVAAGIQVCTTRATKLRAADGPLGGGGVGAGTSPRSGTSTIARSPSSTAGSAGSAVPGSKTTSRTDASTTCSSG